MASRQTPGVGPAAPNRVKRASFHLETRTKKRRKVDQTSDSRSSVVQLACHPRQPVSRAIPFITPGLVLVCGVGDTGQLGLGPDITQRSRPSRFGSTCLTALGVDELALETLVVQVCAGGMHTVCLTSNGRVVTFGCNDEGALGRKTADSASIPESLPPPKVSHLDASLPSSDESEVPIVDETRPAYVPLPLNVKIRMVSAGDSHTAALDSDGQVWLWGTFRGPNGPIGLTQPGEISTVPKRLLSPPSGSIQSDRCTLNSSSNSSHLMPGTHIIKVASGQDHLVCLTEEGRLYTMGCGEQGQLGRVAERFARTGGRSGIGALLHPTECRVRGSVRFSDVWAGGFATFARCQASGSIYACGLNNYGQLGLKKLVTRSAAVNSSAHNGGFEEEEDEEMIENHEDSADDADLSIDAVRVLNDQREADKSEAALIARHGPLVQFMLTRARAFSPDKNWKQFAVSMHHTLALNTDGHVYAIGRSDYGRLGLGKSVSSCGIPVSQPTRVHGLLSNRTCCWVGCGEACSFAVDTEGIAYSWGIGSNQQLGSGDADDDEDCYEPGIIKGKQLQQRYVSMVDAGGQHTVLLAHSALPLSPKPQPFDVAVAVDNTDNAVVNMDINITRTTTETNGMNIDSFPLIDPPMDAKSIGELHEHNDTRAVEKVSNELNPLPPDSSTVPVLIPPEVPQARRIHHLSPCSLTLPPPGGDSNTGSTAGATVNSSVHSSAISDTSSIGSCASNTSTSSQLNSCKSTDGGGTSRCGSFDTYSG